MTRRNPTLVLDAPLAALVLAVLWLLVPLEAAQKAGPREEIADLAALLVEVTEANAAHDLGRQRTLLATADGLAGRPEDRAEVERRQAVLEWKYDHRFEAARARLRSVARTGAEPAKSWLALARMEQTIGEHAAAMAAARRALETAGTAGERRQARLALAEAAIEPAVAARLGGREIDRGLVREGLELARGLVEEEPGRLEPSRRLLQAALLLDDGATALTAWRSYYQVVEGVPAPNAVATAGERLAALLPAWPGEGPESEWPRAELVAALADSRFFVEAALVALGSSREAPADRRTREVVAYAGLLREIRGLTDEYYRQTALGRASRPEWIGQLSAAGRRFVSGAGLEIDLDEKTGFPALTDPLRERFGALVLLGKTAGYQDTHLGHIVVDERRTVEQYGRTAEVRFLVLDHMVSNGFESWDWENGSQHGGWGSGTQIVQVRPAYVDGPQEIWRTLTEEEARAEFLERMERESASDARRAAEDPHGFLPGLKLRLSMEGATRLLARLEERGLEGGELRMAFLAEASRAVQESSIFAHEGRHAIDAIHQKGLASWQKEFNAKLSEVAFAPEPRLALGGILAPDIGSDSAHGRANSKIMRGLVRWMEGNRTEIAGLDPEQPLLPQLDRLTDAQLRAAFASMDPLAAIANAGGHQSPVRPVADTSGGSAGRGTPTAGVPQAPSLPSDGDICGETRPREGKEKLECQIRARVDSLMKEHGFPGFSVVVVVGSETALALSYGVADRSSGRPVTSRTLFQIGSISKSFTGLLLAALVVDGTVRLGDPLASHLPDRLAVPKDSAGGTITLQHLATHTAGLPRYPSNLERVDGEPILGFTLAELYAGLQASTLSQPVGSSYLYSNFAYGLLGHALERATGQSLQAMARRRLLDPLGLEDTTFHLSPVARERLATPYRDDDPRVETVPWEMGALSAAGGLYSTGEELARFLGAMLEPDGAPRPHRWRQMLTLANSPLHRFTRTTHWAYGLGRFVVDDPELGRVLTHGGDVDGYASYYAYAEDHGIGVAFLTNSGMGRPLAGFGEWLLAEAVRELSMVQAQPG